MSHQNIAARYNKLLKQMEGEIENKKHMIRQVYTYIQYKKEERIQTADLFVLYLSLSVS